MNAGQLRHRVTIVDPEGGAVGDPYGQPQGTPTTIGTYWGRVRTISGREAEENRQLAPEATHEILLRYAPEIRPHHQALFDGRTFEIAAPPRDPDNRKIALVLLCKEGHGS